MQTHISKFSAAPLLELILWVRLLPTFATEEWHSCNDVSIDSRLVLGAIGAVPKAGYDFGKFRVLRVKNEYRRFDIWSLQGNLLDRARTELRTRD